MLTDEAVAQACTNDIFPVARKQKSSEPDAPFAKCIKRDWCITTSIPGVKQALPPPPPPAVATRRGRFGNPGYAGRLRAF